MASRLLGGEGGVSAFRPVYQFNRAAENVLASAGGAIGSAGGAIGSAGKEIGNFFSEKSNLLGAAAVGGGLLSGIGSLKSSRAEAKFSRKQADLLDLSADQVMERHAQNVAFIKDDVRKTQGSAATLMRSAGTITDIESLSTIAQAGATEIFLREQEATWTVQQMTAEAEAHRRRAEATEEAGVLGAIGSILGTASIFL